MSGRKVYSFQDLEEMDPNDFLALIEEEIPAGIDSDIEDSDNSEDDDNDVIENNLFDINVMDIVFADDLENNFLEEDLWSSEDEINLCALRHKLFRENNVWTEDANYCLKNIKHFDESFGPALPEDIEEPTDIFLYIFPLIDHIVFHTNLYALQISGGNNNFVPTNSDEIKVFLGINLLMGIKRLPSLRDYWSSRKEIRDTFISSCMSRDRFMWLLKHLHLNDNSVQPGPNEDNYDKLYKIRPLLTKLSETYRLSYKPTKNQAIDESMIPFKGRSSMKQYMPMKPIKRGYKVWIRSDETGYVCQFQIYTGKVSEATEKNLGTRVVLDLTEELVGKGHHIYLDNFFNSLELQKKLQDKCIYACGTARKGRKGLPTDLKKDDTLARGQCDWRVSKDGLVFLKWKDRKSVLFLSNYHDPTNAETVPRKNKDGTREEIECPKLVKDYNANMGFVDKMDMLKSIYTKNPRRCALCSTTAVPHKSRWSCSTCDVGLCLNDKKNCFQDFHTK